MKKIKIKTKKNAKVNLTDDYSERTLNPDSKVDYYKMHTTQSAGILVIDVTWSPPSAYEHKQANTLSESLIEKFDIPSYNIATDPKYYPLFFS